MDQLDALLAAQAQAQAQPAQAPGDPLDAALAARAKAPDTTNTPKFDPSAFAGTLQFGPFDTGIPIGQTATRTLAGVGEGMNNLWQGVKERIAQAEDAISPSQPNLSSVVTGQAPQSRADQVRADIAESRRLDAPLNATTAGMVGNDAGTMAAAAPAAFIPGANTMLGAALIGGGTGYLSPSLSSAETAANTGLGAAGGVAGNLVGKLVGALGARPATVDAELSAAQKGAAQSASDLGFQLTPAKRSGNAVQQQIEAMLQSRPETSGPFNAIAANNQAAGNRIAANAIGVDAPELSAPVLQKAESQIGSVFDKARGIESVPINPDEALSGLAGIESKYEGQYLGNSTVTDHPLFNRVLQFAADGAPSGDQVVTLSSNLGKAARTQMTSQGGDRALGMALYDTKDLIDQSLQGAAGPELSEQLANAREQYRNLMNLTARNNVVNPSSGNVNLKALSTALMQKDKGGFTFGNNDSDLYQAARFAQAFPDIVGNSGTATRMPLSLAEMPSAAGYWALSRAYMNPAVRGMATAAAWPAQKLAQALIAGGRAAETAVGPGIAGRIGTATALGYQP